MNKIVCYSHIGKRTNHEDNFFINGLYLTPNLKKQISNNHYCFVSNSAISSKILLFAISDGMGGHNGGDVASKICVEKLSLAYKELQQYSSLKQIVSYLQVVIGEINNTVCELSHEQYELKGMGATLILFVVYEGECAILNIGDSRAYYFKQNKLFQITKDHTEGQRMLDLGILTRKELFDFSARKNLNRYIGYSQNGYVLQADEYYPNIENGILILCSDGISDFVSDTRIANILRSEKNLEIAGSQLINEAVRSYNSDNATVILISLRR